MRMLYKWYTNIRCCKILKRSPSAPVEHLFKGDFLTLICSMCWTVDETAGQLPCTLTHESLLGMQQEICFPDEGVSILTLSSKYHLCKSKCVSFFGFDLSNLASILSPILFIISFCVHAVSANELLGYFRGIKGYTCILVVRSHLAGEFRLSWWMIPLSLSWIYSNNRCL